MNLCTLFKATCTRVARLRELKALASRMEKIALVHCLSNNGTGAVFYEELHDEMAAEYNELRYWFQARLTLFKEDDSPDGFC